MCYEWFERKKANETLEKDKEQAQSLIQKLKRSAKPRPAPERDKQPAVAKEKATA